MKQCTLRGKGNLSDSKSEFAQVGHQDLDVVKILYSDSTSFKKKQNVILYCWTEMLFRHLWQAMPQ